MATTTTGPEYDVSINGNRGFVGAGFRRDEERARAIFASRVEQRTSADVVTLIVNGVPLVTKNGERKPNARK